MKSLSILKPKDQCEAAIREAMAMNPSALILFAAPSLFQDSQTQDLLKRELKGKTVIGCSTAGEITESGVFKDSICLMALQFSSTEVRTAHQQIHTGEESFSAGQRLAKELQGPKLKAIFVLGPGTNVNGSGLIEGMSAVLGRDVSISGGLAADEINFKSTYQVEAGEIFQDRAVAMGFYGDSIVVSCGSEGGWRPFGPARRVTKVDNNILYELDHKPALQLYKQYIGDKARMLPASGLSYPFAILRNDRSTSGIIRSALDIDHDNEALILAGDMPQGCQVCLMHADTGALTQGAAQAAAEALRTHAGPEEEGCALVVSCVGRKVVLGIDVEDEIEAIAESFLPGTPIAGYYSYGEICSYVGTGRTELHNQTMTITYITERKDQ